MSKVFGTIAIGGLLASPLALSADDDERRPQVPPIPPHGREAARESPDAKRVPDANPAPDSKRMDRIMRQITELHSAGKHDEAHQLEERVRAAGLGNPQDRAQPERGRGEPQATPGGADRKPNPARQAVQAHQKTQAPQGGQPPQARIQHLREAMNHLNAAGYEKLAMAARGEIERIEVESQRQAAEAHRREAKAMTEAGVAPRGDGPDAGGDMRSEMAKLRREIEELRNQIKQLKMATAPR